MEKAVTVIGRAAAVKGLGAQDAKSDAQVRKDHLKVWKEIYQDVRRQWAEAEHKRTGIYRPER